jgi:hypothetical protein
MQEELEALKVALRVLSAFIEHRAPEEADVQALLSHASLSNRRPPDELACEVIQRVLSARRRSASGVAERSEGVLRDVWFGPAKH